MQRGAKPTKVKVEARSSVAKKSRKLDGSSGGQLEQRLTEAVEQQAATSEILRVIGRAPTDLQSVLDAIVASAATLCDSVDAQIFRVDGDVLRLAASYGSLPRIAAGETRPVNRGSVNGRAVVECRTIHVHDLEAESESEWPEAKAFQRRFGHRTTLATPLLREKVPLGVLTIRRMEVRPFSDDQIKRLETFADQAVIAIENARLFNETKEALEQQTATSEILRVISRSQTDVQPVFDAIAANAARLCGATDAIIRRVDGNALRLVAHYGLLPGVSADSLMPFDRSSVMSRAVVDRQTVHIDDLGAQSYGEFPVGRDLAKRFGYRTVLATPLLRDGVPIGAIGIRRLEVRPFSDKQIKLLETFADQAVIAIENARLFTELQERNRDLTEALDQQMATSEILRVISRSQTDAQPVFDTIVAAAMKLCSASSANVLTFDGVLIHLAAIAALTPEGAEAARRFWPRPPGHDLAAARAILTCNSAAISDVLEESEYPVSATAVAGGFRSILAVPLAREGNAIGAIAVGRLEPGPFPGEQIALLETFADQAVIAIENVRLFKELEDKSRQLENASRHKSEFLANMSHELRTPLNAILGFSEVLSERMFGEINEKQAEYLDDILESGRHLLSLINDILDLSKIEAGRMELEATDFDLPSAIEGTLMLVRERAHRRAITLSSEVDAQLGSIRADERKVKQVLLNLLSNALKFTPEGGRIDVRGAVRDGVAAISVTDTGVGIAPEDQQTVFEEFRQVGAAAKKVEGTGLGLAISRKFIELHGGRIWVESQFGKGSTFAFTLPLQ